MNILPLVLSFLILMSCLVGSFIKRTHTSSVSLQTLHTFHFTHRTLHNTVEERLFTKATQKKDKTTSPSAKKEGRRISCRFFTPHPSEAKFNLNLLFETPNPEESPFYPVAIRLLNELYGNLPDFKADLILSEMVDSLLALKAEKTLKGEIPLTELFPKNPKLHKTYYKILKGTHGHFATHQGIPPLDEFFICSLDKTTLYFSFAPPELLKALFGENIKNQILLFEKKDTEEGTFYKSISKTALLNLTQNERTDFQKMLPKMNFTSRIPKKKTLLRKEGTSGMALKMNRPLSSEGK